MARQRGVAAASPERQAQDDKQELLRLVEALGQPAAVLPGDEPERRHIDALIAGLEEAASTSGGDSAPVQQQQQQQLCGRWRLVYASNGTYVTRQAVAQALLSLGQLPGVGLDDITQTVFAAPGGGRDGGASSTAAGLRSDNAAEFGLGPLGTWRLAVAGAWAPTARGDTVSVSFDGVSVQLVGLLGWGWGSDALPVVRVPLPSGGRAAPWTTPYVDGTLRVGRGSSTGNTFLFVRQQ